MSCALRCVGETNRAAAVKIRQDLTGQHNKNKRKSRLAKGIHRRKKRRRAKKGGACTETPHSKLRSRLSPSAFCLPPMAQADLIMGFVAPFLRRQEKSAPCPFFARKKEK
ncbi:hypothetical protein pneo_cds_299 [Pandoravirus neocaledonia]|uniref:Uncharacterized protein n=1 Tax=Pandoravirus neocaledonia TaxID=2107708 RepID=A0A2U7UBT9_9VIRU|nr:hypothetical protein pneo_cds_299 [Pandoravirus neocaledonia]AVK75906.1 hypothetical protein pneo_cds_299 [Pandoravirus neocaledonia]